ncbi:MAG: hypothetical protein JSV42_04555 [Chloroflexota bacterium]|nr:MAG: hypothetical protein JSV42_04555 [Chloroflexota bacterium]
MKTSTSRFGAVQVGIIILALTSAFIHFSLLFPDILFILNGLGYLALLAAYFLPIEIARKNHSLLRWLFILYAAVTIIAWVMIGDKSWPGGALGYVTKVVEIFLIALLVVDGRKSNS